MQRAVLTADVEGRDLRISSRTGSGKTVALGIAVAPMLLAAPEAPAAGKGAQPSVLLVAPTRELANQIGRELTWLYGELSASVCVVTGGTSILAEQRHLAQRPRVVVGTPGRLCDHLSRGALRLDGTRAVVLDEADQMLDLGFREALETLLGRLPPDCRTHLVSATFPQAVAALANRYQHNPLGVSGESAERGHADIEHLAYLLHPRDRYDGLLNVLLMAPEERTLVFVRTRADASGVASQLAGDGLKASALSGDLAQAERTRTLEAFRRGQIHVLVCTDVASRGIDVPDVTRVIHADLPDAPEALTHRSGRTGRAGNKGVSILLVPTSAMGYAQRLLRAANITAELRPAPDCKQVQSARDARLFRELVQTSPDGEGHDRLGTELLQTLGPEQAVALLLGVVRRQGPSQPRVLTPVSLNRPRPPARKPFHKPQAPARRGFGRPRRHA